MNYWLSVVVFGLPCLEMTTLWSLASSHVSIVSTLDELCISNVKSQTPTWEIYTPSNIWVTQVINLPISFASRPSVYRSFLVVFRSTDRSWLNLHLFLRWQSYGCQCSIRLSSQIITWVDLIYPLSQVPALKYWHKTVLGSVPKGTWIQEKKSARVSWGLWETAIIQISVDETDLLSNLNGFENFV